MAQSSYRSPFFIKYSIIISMSFIFSSIDKASVSTYSSVNSSSRLNNLRDVSFACSIKLSISSGDCRSKLNIKFLILLLYSSMSSSLSKSKPSLPIGKLPSSSKPSSKFPQSNLISGLDRLNKSRRVLSLPITSISQYMPCSKFAFLSLSNISFPT